MRQIQILEKLQYTATKSVFKKDLEPQVFFDAGIYEAAGLR